MRPYFRAMKRTTNHQMKAKNDRKKNYHLFDHIPDHDKQSPSRGPGVRHDTHTELQTDFQGGYNWVNLFRTDFQWAIARQIHLNAGTISTVKTLEKRLANDLQTFSNIEEENIPLAIAVLGLDWQVGNSTLFMEIRNLNEDYFTSACTSLFTNSSCGIFPTLSANYPIANYPVASIGIDYKLLLENWLFETSLYNGTGYRDFTGKENVFRFCPRTDGILSVTSINYRKYGNEYYLGIALHYGLPVGHEMGTEKRKRKRKNKTRSSGDMPNNA